MDHDGGTCSGEGTKPAALNELSEGCLVWGTFCIVPGMVSGLVPCGHSHYITLKLILQRLEKQLTSKWAQLS